jgi:hypothetical protein
LNGAVDALHDSDVKLWINLNAVTVRDFNDADFPAWKGWKLVDDDSATTDSKCDSVEIGKILNTNSEINPARKAEEMLLDPVVRLGTVLSLSKRLPRLRRGLCSSRN